MTRDETMKQLLDSIRLFNRRAPKVLQKAMDEGGPDRVNELEAEYENLRKAYFDLVRAKLDENHEKFGELLSQTADASAEIDLSIEKLESSAKVLTAVANATSVVKKFLDVIQS